MHSFWHLLPKTRLTIPPLTTRKPDEIYETKVSRHWIAGSSVFPEDKSMNEESSECPQLPAWREGGAQAEPESLSELKRHTGDFRNIKADK